MLQKKLFASPSFQRLPTFPSLQSQLPLSYLLLTNDHPSSQKHPCDYTGPTQIFQDNLPIRRSLIQSYLQTLVGILRQLSGKESACQCRRQIRSLGWEDSLKKEMAIHSSTSKLTNNVEKVKFLFLQRRKWNTSDYFYGIQCSHVHLDPLSTFHNTERPLLSIILCFLIWLLHCHNYLLSNLVCQIYFSSVFLENITVAYSLLSLKVLQSYRMPSTAFE